MVQKAKKWIKFMDARIPFDSNMHSCGDVAKCMQNAFSVLLKFFTIENVPFFITKMFN